MNKLAALSKNNLTAFRSFMLGAMCFLTLLCIASAFQHDIFKDSYVCFVMISNICGLVFLTLLAVYLFSGAVEITRSMRYFTVFFINLYIATFFSALFVSFYMIPEHKGLLTLLFSLCCFFVTIIYLTLWLYLKQSITESAITRAVTVFICITIVAYASCIIVNLFHPILFLITEEGTFSEEVTDYISLITVIFYLLLLCVATFTSGMTRNRKFSFLCCIFAPTLFAMMSVNQELIGRGIYILGVICLTVLLPLYLIFFNTYDEMENNILRYEKEQIELMVSAMISQMQPHFLCNSLAVIAALCEEDPKLAAQATNAFSDYLRENMDFADKSSPISFSEELNHIKTYVWLEKLRFPNKLHVEYDISCTAFPVPALSVQPMVENAIKHGICKAKTGGTVRIRTFETDLFYNVTISDDGVGFDVEAETDDNKPHLGIKNTRYRLREMLGGNLDIESVPGKGTVITMKIPK